MDVLRISRKTNFSVVIRLLVGEKTQITHVYGIKLFINNIKYSSNSKSNTLRIKSKLFNRSVPGFPYFTSDIIWNHCVSISIYGAESLIKNEISSDETPALSTSRPWRSRSSLTRPRGKIWIWLFGNLKDWILSSLLFVNTSQRTASRRRSAITLWTRWTSNQFLTVIILFVG